MLTAFSQACTKGQCNPGQQREQAADLAGRLLTRGRPHRRDPSDPDHRRVGHVFRGFQKQVDSRVLRDSDRAQGIRGVPQYEIDKLIETARREGAVGK